MRIRRLSMVGIAVLAAISLTVTGCGESTDGSSSGSGAAASSSPSPKPPKEALAEAAQKSAKESFHYTLKYSVIDMAGDFDSAKKAALIKTEFTSGSQTIAYDTMLIGTDAYLKYYNAPNLPKKWLHIGVDKLGADASLWKTLDDPTGANAYSSAAVDLQRVDDRTFKGTVDLSKTAGSGAVQKSALDAMGDSVKAVPIEALLDEKGRLSKITLQMPAVKEQPAAPLEITFSDYGKSVEIAAPAAADTQEAPDAVLKGFK